MIKIDAYSYSILKSFSKLDFFKETRVDFETGQRRLTDTTFVDVEIVPIVAVYRIVVRRVKPIKIRRPVNLRDKVFVPIFT